MRLLDRVHDRQVYGRRVRVLSEALSRLLPGGTSVLDIGCGDGLVSSLVASRSGAEIRGADVLVRPETHIPVTEFDGRNLPFEPSSFDWAMLVDVVHHAEDPMALLSEALRVSRSGLLVKDHLREGLFAQRTLAFMDRVGNARHGVALPCNYWSSSEWEAAFGTLRLRKEVYLQSLGLYPFPADLWFGRRLHFLARLVKRGETS